MIRKTVQRILIGTALLLCALIPAARPYAAQSTSTATPRTLASSYSVKLITEKGDVTEGNLRVERALVAWSLEFTWPTEKVKGAALIDGDTLAFVAGPASCSLYLYKIEASGRLNGQFIPANVALVSNPGTEIAVPTSQTEATPNILKGPYAIKRLNPSTAGPLFLGTLTFYAGGASEPLRAIWDVQGKKQVGVGLRMGDWIAFAAGLSPTDLCGVGLATLLDDDSIEGSYVQLNSTAITDFLGLKDEP